VNSYVKTLFTVVESDEEAKKKIYSVCTPTYTGFGALISEELSYKVKELPGVCGHNLIHTLMFPTKIMEASYSWMEKSYTDHNFDSQRGSKPEVGRALDMIATEKQCKLKGEHP